MKIACNRKHLSESFQAAASIVPTRHTKEILHNVKAEATGGGLVLSSTDQEIGLRVDVPDVHVVQPGTVLLHADLVGRVLRESDSECIKIEAQENNLFVRSEHAEIRMPTIDPDEYPSVSIPENVKCHSMGPDRFCQMVRRTAFSTDPNSARYALGGVLLELSKAAICAVATDGRRLAIDQIHCSSWAPEESSAIVPVDALHAMARCIGSTEDPVDIAVCGNGVLIKTAGRAMVARALAGKFPAWKALAEVRKDSAKVEVSAGLFLSAIRQASVVTDKETRGLDVAIRDGSMLLTASHAVQGESRVEIPVDYAGESIEVKLDYRFVAEFLNALHRSSTVEMYVETPDKPVHFQSEGSYKYVVMPMTQS